MASTQELAFAFVQLLLMSERAPPLTLMNPDVDGAAIVIATIADRCAELKVRLAEVAIGAELSQELGLLDGAHPKHGERPIIRVVDGLGRQIEFRRAI